MIFNFFWTFFWDLLGLVHLSLVSVRNRVCWIPVGISLVKQRLTQDAAWNCRRIGPGISVAFLSNRSDILGIRWNKVQKQFVINLFLWCGEMWGNVGNRTISSPDHFSRFQSNMIQLMTQDARPVFCVNRPTVTCTPLKAHCVTWKDRRNWSFFEDSEIL